MKFEKINNNKLKIFILFIIPVIYGVLAVFIGKDVNWDLRNYHFYNAYAFLENRFGFDFAPAQLQSFFNPIIDLPFYFLIHHFNSATVGFFLGFIHGLNLLIVFFIFYKVISLKNELIRLLLSFIIAVLSGIAPGFISELGGMMNDNLISLFVLTPILLLIISNEKDCKLSNKKKIGHLWTRNPQVPFEHVITLVTLYSITPRMSRLCGSLERSPVA